MSHRFRTIAGIGLGAALAIPALAVTSVEAAAVPAGPHAAGSQTSVSSSELAECPWMNTHLSADARANLLLAASTLDQKIRWLDEQAANTPTQTTFGGVSYPAQVPCTPTVVYTDGPDYVRLTQGVTNFPAQISLAASWDPGLAYQKGAAEADEAFRSGKNGILGPAVNSGRTPLDGRTPEFLGEDPLLSGTLAAAQVNGIQNGNPNEPVLAVLKHYIANEQELDRTLSSSNMDGRTLQEVYNLPFAIALSQSSPGGVMCSYNQLNGIYACQNPVMNNVLRGEDHFQGYVVSDFGAVHSTAPSLNAGMDQELNVPVYLTPANVNAAIDDGQVTIPEIDDAAFLVIRSYIAAGLFDHPLPATPSTDSSTPAHQALADQIAEQGSVLLKNQGSILPLTSATKSIAVIGPTASNTPTNGISAQTVCEEVGADAIPAFCPDPVAPLDAITARAAKDGASVTYNDGSDVASAAAAAAKADVAIIFAYTSEGEGADAANLSLDSNGDSLISAVAAANPNTIVVLETGSAVTMPWLSSAKGVMEAWYPGDQGGTAIASLLYGDTNFSGRLPLTFPVSEADLPTSTPAQYPGVFSNGSTTRPAGDDTSIRQVSYSEGLAVGYKWYQSQHIAPLFPFGFGLSYTTFSYSNLQIQSTGQGDEQRIDVRFTVTNTGTRQGTDTPQIYLTLPVSTGEPGSRLVAFGQVQLQPGQSRQMDLTIDAGSAQHPLSYWDITNHDWATAPGTYVIHIATSAENFALSNQFTE
jgi:beta-glucosidase